MWFWYLGEHLILRGNAIYLCSWCQEQCPNILSKKIFFFWCGILYEACYSLRLSLVTVWERMLYVFLLMYILVFIPFYLLTVDHYKDFFSQNLPKGEIVRFCVLWLAMFCWNKWNSKMLDTLSWHACTTSRRAVVSVTWKIYFSACV